MQIDHHVCIIAWALPKLKGCLTAWFAELIHSKTEPWPWSLFFLYGYILKWQKLPSAMWNFLLYVLICHHSSTLQVTTFKTKIGVLAKNVDIWNLKSCKRQNNSHSRWYQKKLKMQIFTTSSFASVEKRLFLLIRWLSVQKWAFVPRTGLGS